jgi:hypothetical protein
MLILLTAVVLMTGSGCSLDTTSGETSLLIRLDEHSRAVFSPSISMETAAYRITLSGPEGENLTIEREKGASSAIDGLSPGLWTMEIEGWNSWDGTAVSGQQVAYLESNGLGVRSKEFSLRHGRVNEVTARLVPLDEGSGTLELTFDWSGVDERLAAGEPGLQIAVTNISDKFAYYTHDGSADTILTQQLGQPLSTRTFENLPAGWYQIITTLSSQSGGTEDPSIWSGIDFARIVPGDEKTAGRIEIADLMLETGSADLWDFEERMDDALQVSITSEQTEEILYTGIERSFSCGYTDADAVYQWYVDGQPVSGADSADFTHSFSQRGEHSVLVAVEDNGAWNGAVTSVELHQGYDVGDRGPAGGWISFIDTANIYDQWSYLEAAPADSTQTYAWSNVTDSTAGTSMELGTGKANNEAILAQAGHSGSAAQYTAELESGGFTDWFLPSLRELELLHANLHGADPAVGFFTGGTYWSSSEVDSETAYAVDFSDGGTSLIENKAAEHTVRPIRAF